MYPLILYCKEVHALIIVSGKKLCAYNMYALITHMHLLRRNYVLITYMHLLHICTDYVHVCKTHVLAMPILLTHRTDETKNIGNFLFYQL